ncbi:colicin immunity domain-containing protein [Pseudomonas spelaei]
MVIIDLAKQLTDSSISGKDFTARFFKLWRSERDSGILGRDDKSLGRCLSLMFGLVDSFTDGPKDHPAELTENELKQEISKLLSSYGYI